MKGEEVGRAHATLRAELAYFNPCDPLQVPVKKVWCYLRDVPQDKVPSKSGELSQTLRSLKVSVVF